MSDPGSSYRTRDEISKVRQERDPLERLRKLVLDLGLASGEELKAVEKERRGAVDAAVARAKEAPEPQPEALVQHVYQSAGGAVARGVDAQTKHPLVSA